MNISVTKRNGKFSNSENLDIVVIWFLTKYGCLKPCFTRPGFALNLFLKSGSVVVFSTLPSSDDEGE